MDINEFNNPLIINTIIPSLFYAKTPYNIGANMNPNIFSIIKLIIKDKYLYYLEIVDCIIAFIIGIVDVPNSTAQPITKETITKLLKKGAKPINREEAKDKPRLV